MTSFLAGLAGISWPRFLFWNAVGGVVWATGVGLLAYFGGKALADAVSRCGVYGAAAVVLAVLAFAATPRLISRLHVRGAGSLEVGVRERSKSRP